jgi:hypothetical protein
MKPSKSANELSAQRRRRRTARPSRSAYDLPATCTSTRRQSRPRSNLGDSNQLATSRSNLVPDATLSTYRASTIRVHNTHFVAVGYGGRSIRSATSRTSRGLPRLRTSASFRRPGSAPPPTTRDPLGGMSGGLSERPSTGQRDGFRGSTSNPGQCKSRPATSGGEAPGGTPMCPRPMFRVRRGVLTPKIGTEKRLTCGPSLVRKHHSTGNFPQSIR